jgi:hypothetical protein
MPRDGRKNMSGGSKHVSGVTSEHGTDLSQICDTRSGGTAAFHSGGRQGCVSFQKLLSKRR